MNTTSGTWNARRFALLLGMLLHLLGAAAIPAFHADGPGYDPSPGSAFVDPRPGDDGSPGGFHDELDCTLCQASGELALPAHGTDLPLASAVRRVETPSEHAARTHRPASPARTRAPPLA